MSTAVLDKVPSVKPPPPRRLVRVVVFFAVFFIAGGVTGAGIATWYWQPVAQPTLAITPPSQPQPPTPNRGFSTEGFLSHMRKEYDLNDEQAEKLTGIVKENRERIDQINKEFRPRFGQSIERMNSEISAILDSEQRSKFEKKQEEMRARWASRRHDSKRDGNRSTDESNKTVPQPADEPASPEEKSLTKSE